MIPDCHDSIRACVHIRVSSVILFACDQNCDGHFTLMDFISNAYCMSLFSSFGENLILCLPVKKLGIISIETTVEGFTQYLAASLDMNRKLMHEVYSGKIYVPISSHA